MSAGVVAAQQIGHARVAEVARKSLIGVGAAIIASDLNTCCAETPLAPVSVSPAVPVLPVPVKVWMPLNAPPRTAGGARPRKPDERPAGRAVTGAFIGYLDSDRSILVSSKAQVIGANARDVAVKVRTVGREVKGVAKAASGQVRNPPKV